MLLHLVLLAAAVTHAPAWKQEAPASESGRGGLSGGSRGHAKGAAMAAAPSERLRAAAVGATGEARVLDTKATVAIDEASRMQAERPPTAAGGAAAVAARAAETKVAGKEQHAARAKEGVLGVLEEGAKEGVLGTREDSARGASAKASQLQRRMPQPMSASMLGGGMAGVASPEKSTKAAATEVAGQGLHVARAKEGVLGMLEVPPPADGGAETAQARRAVDTPPALVAVGEAASPATVPFLSEPVVDRIALFNQAGRRALFYMISAVLVGAGMTLCSGLGKKIEKQEVLTMAQSVQQPSCSQGRETEAVGELRTDLFCGQGFVQGATVIVTSSFMSNGDPPVALKAGQSGVIQKIDAVGDALIRFAGHSVSQWVYESNYVNLRLR